MRIRAFWRSPSPAEIWPGYDGDFDDFLEDTLLIAEGDFSLYFLSPCTLFLRNELLTEPCPFKMAQQR